MWPTDWVPRADLWAGVATPLHLGILLAVTGNLLIAFSLALQKWVHTQVESDDPQRVTQGRRLFWVALLGLMAGEMGNFAAFGLASPTVISPLGAVAVVANALIAFLVLKERFFLRNALGLVVTIVGSVVVVLNAPPTVDALSVETFVQLISAPPSVVYFAVVCSSVAALLLAEPALGHRFLLLHVMICSLVGSVTVLASSAISHFISRLKAHPEVLTSPVPYLILPILISTAVFQLKHLNQAQKHFDSNQVVPVYYITFTLCSISGGGVVYQDFWGFRLHTALGFIFGCVLCFGGVYLITKRGPVVTLPPKTERSPAPVDVGLGGAGHTLPGMRSLGSPDDDKEWRARVRGGAVVSAPAAVGNDGSIPSTPVGLTVARLLSRSPQHSASSSSNLLSAIAIAAQRRAGGDSQLGPRALTEDAGSSAGLRGPVVLGRGLVVDTLGDPTLGEMIILASPGETRGEAASPWGLEGPVSGLGAEVPVGSARGHRRTMSYDPPAQLRTLGYSEPAEARGWLAGSRISQFISATLDHEIIVGEEAPAAAEATCPGSPPPPAPLQLSHLLHLMPGASASQLDLSPIIRPLSVSRGNEHWASASRRSARSRVLDARGELPWSMLEQTHERDEAGGGEAGHADGSHGGQGRTAARARERGAEML